MLTVLEENPEGVSHQAAMRRGLMGHAIIHRRG
jgi:hypothetical protein